MTSTIPWQQRLSTITAATRDKVIGWYQRTRHGKSYAPDMIWSALQTESAQHAETPAPAALPLRTIGDLRAALRSGHGFPGDRESFEADLQRALEASSEKDLNAVAAVIVEYRGRVRLCQDPDFEIAVQEGIDLAARLKREAQGR